MMNVASIYDFTVEKPDGSLQSMKDYEGSVTVIVNTASKCGFTVSSKNYRNYMRSIKSKDLRTWFSIGQLQ